MKKIITALSLLAISVGATASDAVLKSKLEKLGACHYCHLLHQQIKEYNDLGITIRYLAFPRSGASGQTAGQMEAIFAAKDPVFALNEAEKGNLPKELKTPNIVKKHYMLGVQFGVGGTPTIITSDGETIGGYLKPADLLAELEG